MTKLNEYQKNQIKRILGQRITITASFDLERDFLNRLTRDQLLQALSSFNAPATKRLLALGPTEAEWLALAKRGDKRLSNRAKRAIMANPNVSHEALEYILLAGTKKTPERKKAFSMVMAMPPNKALLRWVFPRFKKGPETKAAWQRYAKLKLDVDDLQNVLKDVTDREVLDDAWVVFLARQPTASDICHVMVFCRDQLIRNRAGAVLANDPFAADELEYVVSYASDQTVLAAAARRLLAAGKRGAAAIATNLRDKTLAHEGWKRFNRRQSVELRNMTVAAVRSDIRALALAVAQTMKWTEPHDLEYFRSSKDPAVRRAFAGK